MFSIQTMAISAAAIAMVSGTAGFALHARGEAQRTAAAIAKSETRIKAASAKVLDQQLAEKAKAQTEAAYCKGEVEKVNTATAQQVADLKAALLADQDSRTAAAARTEKAALRAISEATATGERFRLALDGMKKVADECARAPISTDARRLLDDIVARAAP